MLGRSILNKTLRGNTNTAMSAKATTIELNGKKYDAHTGKIIASATSPKSNPTTSTRTGTETSHKTIDGFTRRRRESASANTTAHSVHKKTEKSKTLMRNAVKKPIANKSQRKSEPSAMVSYHKPTSHAVVDEKRVKRASRVQQSALIKRFGTPQKAIKSTPAILPVQPEPAAPPFPSLDVHHKKVSSLQASQSKRNTHKRTFQKVIDNSTSHNQPAHPKTTRLQHMSHKLRVSTRSINITAASLAVLLLTGFIAYQNVPNLSMRVAAARAGVHGTMPGYQPAGFGLAGPIAYQPGQITLKYASRSDDRQFEVSQQSTDWNSDSLLENFIAANQATYQTFQDSGKTIYIYDNNNATWVDGGVWYRIEGKSALNNDQLLRMAVSM